MQKTFWSVAAAVLTASCVTLPPVDPPVDPPSPPTFESHVTVLQWDRTSVPDLSCTLTPDEETPATPPTPIVCTYNGIQAFFTVPSKYRHRGGDIRFHAPKFVPVEGRVVIEDDIPEYTMVPARQRRPGRVRVNGRGFVDDAGPYLGVGASLFWGPWGYLHDRERLVRNLDFLAEHGYDWVRVLAMVGPTSWEDRTVSAADILSTDVVSGFADLAYERGLRVEWTIFGGVETAPSQDLRRQVVDRVVSSLVPRPDTVQFIEIANEAWQNGFPYPEGQDELFSLAARVRARSPFLVALSSPSPDTNWTTYYAGSEASLFTVHLERDISGTGGYLRPVRQAREAEPMQWPWISNEPIGPQSSVAADDDPVRLGLAAMYAWLCKGAGYVLHTGAGIRGGGQADRNRGRAANIWEVARIEETSAVIQSARAVLPATLPNFAWFNGNRNFPGYPFEVDALADEANVLRAFAGIGDDGTLVVIPIGVRRPTPFIARRAMEFTVYSVSPAGLQAVSRQTLQPGQTYVQNPTGPSNSHDGGAVFIGRVF